MLNPRHKNCRTSSRTVIIIRTPRPITLAMITSQTVVLVVLLPATRALKRQSSFVVTGMHHVYGSAHRLAAFVSDTIPACQWGW